MTFDLSKFKSTKPATEHVTAHGKRIAVETLDTGVSRPKKRKPFKALWVQIPHYWAEKLERHNSAAMYRLAVHILRAAFQCEQVGGGGIILSVQTTRLPRQTRLWAAKKMVAAGMIKIEQHGNQAVRVTRLLHMPPRKRQKFGD